MRAILFGAVSLLACVTVGCESTVVITQTDAGSGAGDGAIRSDGGRGDGGQLMLPDLDAGELPGGVCADQGREIKITPVDMLVVLDVSYSMDYDLKWVAVKSAMKSFVSRREFDGLGVGLQYFPLRAQCSIGAYQSPAVPFGVLPEAAQTIAASLDFQQMQGGTPTVPVLEGTSRYAKLWATQHPERQAVIVLATDGVPDDTCAAAPDGGLSNSLENVLTVARGAAMESPSIKTFVIGVGKDLVALNRIAVAGGTDKALLVDSRVDADIAFLDALTQVRNSALGCSFEVPYVRSVDPTQARVRFIANDPRRSFVVPRVTPDGCRSGSGAGWYFEGQKPNTKLILCRPSCEALGNGATGRLYVEFGCNIE